MIEEEIDEFEAFERVSVPFRNFMLRHVRERDLTLFVEISGTSTENVQPEDLSLRILIPAFMISEIRRAFEIGFLIFVPFLVIDMVVASVLMAMGMMMPADHHRPSLQNHLLCPRGRLAHGSGIAGSELWRLDLSP